MDVNLEKTKQKNNEKEGNIQKLKKELAQSITEKNQLKQDISKLNDAVGNLEKERDKSGHDAASSKAKLIQIVEELKLKKNLISELKKENAELDAKLK
jgi:chromosome segregation ATPase